MGYIALAMRDVILFTENHGGTSSGRFLIEHSNPKSTKLYEDLPDEIAEVCMTQTFFKEQVWQLFFDGTLRTGPKGNIVAGVGVVLVSPQNYVIPRAFSLTEPCSNTVAEYKPY